MKKLNLGCGKKIKDGWVNLDIANLPGVDVVHDITKLPLPFGDNEFDEVLCEDILEHVDYIPVLKDIHRILKPGGKVTIRVPHFTSKNNYIDPTHRHRFSIKTFGFFVDNPDYKRDYYFDFAFSKINSAEISFERSSRFFFYNRFVAPIVNRNPKSQYRYESSGWSRLFPAENIIVELIK